MKAEGKSYTNDLDQWEYMYGDTPCRVIIREMFHYYNRELQTLTEENERMKGLLKDAVHWNSNVNATGKIEWDIEKKKLLNPQKNES